jgi:hypothetical protein
MKNVILKSFILTLNALIFLIILQSCSSPGEFTQGNPAQNNQNNTVNGTVPLSIKSLAISNILSDSADLKCILNGNGKIYAIAVPANSIPPSSADVKAGINYNNVNVASYFSDSSIFSTLEFSLLGLLPSNSYDIYVTAEDKKNTIIDPPVKLSLTTNPVEVKILDWSQGYPKYDSVTSSSFKYYIAQNKPGKIYFIVVRSGSDTPSQNDIKTGIPYGNTEIINSGTKVINTADNQYYSTISALEPSSGYDIYAYGESDAGEVMASSSKISLKTSGAPPAELLSISPTDKSSNVNLDTKIELTFSNNLDAGVIGSASFNNSPLETAGITISGKTITLNTILKPLTNYSGIELNGFKDSSGNIVSLKNDGYSFSTQAGETASKSPVFTNSDMELPMNDSAGLKPAGTVYNNSVFKEGKQSLEINGSGGTANGFIFNSNTNCNPKLSNTKITFWIKGTASGKSISINFGLKMFNLGTINNSGTVITPSGSNSYTGSLTFTEWTKITLDIANINDAEIINNKLSFKYGSSGIYNIFIDEIMYEP